MHQLGFLWPTTDSLRPFVGGQIRRSSVKDNCMLQGEVAALTVDQNVLSVRFAWLGKSESLYGRWVECGHYDDETGKYRPMHVNPWTKVQKLDMSIHLIDYTVFGPNSRSEFWSSDGSFGGGDINYDGGCLHLVSQISDDRFRFYPKNWDDIHEEFAKIYPSEIRDPRAV